MIPRELVRVNDTPDINNLIREFPVTQVFPCFPFVCNFVFQGSALRIHPVF